MVLEQVAGNRPDVLIGNAMRCLPYEDVVLMPSAEGSVRAAVIAKQNANSKAKALRVCIVMRCLSRGLCRG